MILKNSSSFKKNKFLIQFKFYSSYRRENKIFLLQKCSLKGYLTIYLINTFLIFCTISKIVKTIIKKKKRNNTKKGSNLKKSVVF